MAIADVVFARGLADRPGTGNIDEGHFEHVRMGAITCTNIDRIENRVDCAGRRDSVSFEFTLHSGVSNSTVSTSPVIECTISVLYKLSCLT